MKNFDNVVTIFESVVSRYPERCAIRCQGKSWTYQELNAAANRLAARLRRLGTTRDALVGIHLDRSFELIVAIFAVLKADGAYLPLDLASPEDRLKFMVEDSAVKVVLTDSQRAPRFSSFDGTVIRLDDDSLAGESVENPPSTVGPANIAYVIYTSGSTGKPKGVLVTHENVARLFTATDAWYGFGPDDVWTMFHSCAFDFSVWEIFGALLYGGSLVIVPYQVSRSAEAFHELLVSEKVTVLNQTPSAFRQLVQADAGHPRAALALRYIIFGGEALEFQSLVPWFERYGDKQPRCINMYGITETTVHVTYRPITRRDVDANSGSNIGIPIPDLQVYLVDDQGRRVTGSEPGEILVGGAGVAAGYLNRADLTRERFIPNAFEPNKSDRLYRTGDRARFLANGDLEYLGRIDHQVKIRGFRIELDEINSVLARYPGVRESTVIARADSDGEHRLIAYLVVADPKTPPAVEALRAHLSAKLPSYMVPAAYVFLQAFPLTLNGKLDRDKLPAPGSDRPALEAAFVAPKGDLEEGIAKIWRAILHLDEVGANDNFFNLGGDSLSAMNMLAQLEKLIGRSVGILPMLEGGTIRDLAAAAADNAPITPPPMIMCTQPGTGTDPFFYAHGDYQSGGFYCQRLAQIIGQDQAFYSIAPHGTFGGAMPPTIEEMAEDYVSLIRSVQPHGPYQLGGFCNGAVTMYDVAQRLARAGETVKLLVLLDPPDLYFFVLRRRIMQIGKVLGMSEGQGRTVYQRIAEGVEIWRDQGALTFGKEFATRSVEWIERTYKGFFELPVEETRPNLNLHYYEALARYEPVPYQSSGEAWIILREGESARHPKQVSYWSRYITKARFEVVVGEHLEFKNSLNEISGVIAKALKKASRQ
jgi:amino acid adenylation domain-containing protein